MDASRDSLRSFNPACAGVRRPAWMAAWALMLTLVLCAQARTQMATGRALDRTALLVAMNYAMPQAAHGAPVEFSALEYAEVRRDWLDGFMRRFRADLSRKNVPVNLARGRSGWQERFNCVAFTELFLGNAQAELMVDLWHSDLPVQRPAIVAIWYTPDNAPVDVKTGLRNRHSIVLIVTESGTIFVDPQVGEIHLSVRELVSISRRSA